MRAVTAALKLPSGRETAEEVSFHHLTPNDVTQTRWQLPERRYFGFTFAWWQEEELCRHYLFSVNVTGVFNGGEMSGLMMIT